MDSGKMHWSTEPFCAAYSVLVTNEDTLTPGMLKSTLSPIQDDLRALLATPPKSETSRQTLGKRNVQIDGKEVELNEAFLNAAVRVADELNLDELVAAHLVFYASEDSKCLGVDVVESAVSLFFVRRQYIIDMVRFGLETLPVDEFPLILGSARRVEHIFLALKAVEQSMDDLSEKSKTGRFMGFDQNLQFRQLLELQREFLIKEHDRLGGVLRAYVQASGSQENDGAAAIQIMKHLATFKSFDSRMLSYFPALVTWFSAPHTTSFINVLYSYFSGADSQKWNLGYWQAALALVLYSFVSDEELYPDAPISYEAVLKSVRQAIDDGAIEFLLALSQDVRTQEGSAHFDKYRPLVRSRVPPLHSWLPEPSVLTLLNLQSALDSVIVSFISNLADILKEMRLSEEDMYLAMNELDEDPQAVSPGEDLERFFLLVATTYRDQPDSISGFFDDPGNALYGFLVWGSDCQASFMSATYTELLSSLASGAQNSLDVHRFLLEAEKRQSQADDGFILNWKSMYDVVDYYVRELTAPQSGSTTSPVTATTHSQNGSQVVVPSVMALPPVQGLPMAQARGPTIPPNSVIGTSTPVEAQPSDNMVVPVTYGAPNQATQWGFSEAVPLHPTTSHSQLSDDTLLVLSAYLGLVSRVAGQCAEAREYAREISNSPEGARDFTILLFRLLRVQQPLTASIFDALCPFARQDMWSQLDTYVVSRFEEVLVSTPEVLSFIKLLAALVSQGGTDSARLPDYIDFVTHSVLVWAANIKEKTNVHTILQLQCLRFIQELLKVSSCQTVFRACFDSKVYEAIFTIVTAGVDEIISLTADHPQVCTITRAVELIATLLKRSAPPLWFNKPVLYNLHIIPHLALYAGTNFEQLSLASIEVLYLLEQTAEFRPTITRHSRILSILSSTSEATRIRVGFMARVQDPFTSSAVKAALFELLVHELEQRESPRPVMTAAHYLLGFRQSDLGLELKLELDKGVGGIASGNSMFGVVCDLLLGCLAGEIQSTRLLKLSSQILGQLTKESLTSEMVLDYMRPSQFVLTTIGLEPVNPSVAEFEDFYEHRAIMLEIWIQEVHTCQEKVYLTLENHYLEKLEPILFTLLDFMKYPRNSVSLRCLKSWCKLVPILIASDSPLAGPSFVLRAIQTLIPLLVDFSRETPTFAHPVASLLVSLLLKHESGGVDEMVVNRMQPLLEAALLSVQPSKMNSELRTDLYALCFNLLRMSLQTQSQLCMGKVLDSITLSGPRLLEIVCDDSLGSPNETLRLSALSLLQITAILARSLQSVYVAEVFVTYNFTALLVEQTFRALESGRANEHSRRYSRIALSLLLQLGQTRKGAFDILHTKLFPHLNDLLPKMEEESLLLSVQLLVALVLSVGADNDVVLKHIKELLEKHRYVLEGIMERDTAAAHDSLQTPDLDNVASHLAKHVAVLVDLTGSFS